MRMAHCVGRRVSVIRHLPIRRRIILVAVGGYQLVTEPGVDREVGPDFPSISNEVSLVRRALLSVILCRRLPGRSNITRHVIGEAISRGIVPDGELSPGKGVS